MSVIRPIKQAIPWWAKIAAKTILSRTPINYRVWKLMGLIEHGDMDKPDYAYHVFLRHFERSDFARQETGWVGLELGPGDSLASSILARAHGARALFLVDAGPHASRSLRTYRTLASYLIENGLSAHDLLKTESLEEMLGICNTKYMTCGLSSLRSIPDQSVDFAWSHAVLEHIKRSEFVDTMRELQRIIAPGGIISHRVDLRDHLGNALNNLRFSEGIWESPWMSKSGFYTNRIRFSEMLSIFQNAGFSLQLGQVDRWEQLPTPKRKMTTAFRSLPDDDLCVSGFDTLLRPRAG